MESNGKEPDPEDAPGAGSPARTPIHQADGFASVRVAHENEMVEDYVELIADLVASQGEARAVDMAERLGVKPSTVTKNLARLLREGFVHRERYRSVFLTEKGEALAEACRQRHRTVVATLVAMGVDAETAERDAEGIEHHVSDATLAAFERFIGRRS